MYYVPYIWIHSSQICSFQNEVGLRHAIYCLRHDVAKAEENISRVFPT